MMDIGSVIHSYGGPALFVWAWLQGEAAVIVGDSLATQGYWPFGLGVHAITRALAKRLT